VKTLKNTGTHSLYSDEQGLGKTAVAVTFLAWILTAGLRGVIVTPLSLVTPWKEEIVAWEPRLLVHVIEAKNNKEEKTTIIKQWKTDNGILLTSKFF